MDDFETKLNGDLKRGVRGESGSLVDSEWLEPEQLRGDYWRYRDKDNRCAGIVLGYRNGMGVGTCDNRHILTVAGSRGGKGVSLLVPNLLLYDGSVLAIDPKGELAQITARARREKGQKVVILDPFGETGGATGSFNPLSALDMSSDFVKDDAGQIADALVVPNERDPHWTDKARDLVKALILYTLTLPEADRNLITVWQLLRATHPVVTSLERRSEGKFKGRQALFQLMAGCEAPFQGSVSGTGKAYQEMADKELAGVLSTAEAQLEFLDSKAMEKVLTGDDVKLSELKTGKTTIYLCLPATRMGTHSRWLRVIINLALTAMERTKVKLDIPVLMVLDEFPVLGTMKSIETAAGLMAGFGVKLWVVLQDISQVERLYAKSWQTFVGNAGIMTFWANSDKKTLDYVSDKLGQTSVRLRQSNDITAQQKFSGASGVREELRVQRLAAQHELERILARDNDRILVTAAGKPPVILERIIYFRDSNFVGKFDSVA